MTPPSSIQEKHCFDLIKERPEVLNLLATFMTVKRDGRPKITDFFRWEKQLAEGSHGYDKDAIILVMLEEGKATRSSSLGGDFQVCKGG